MLDIIGHLKYEIFELRLKVQLRITENLNRIGP